MYDPSLIQRETGPADGSDIVVNMEAGDVPDAIPPVDVPDGGDVQQPDVPDGTDVPLVDHVDVPIDNPNAPDCAPIIAAGHNCVEPFAGQGFSPDDPRLVAPAGIGLIDTNPPVVVVTDPGTARVMAYAADGTGGHRIAGTGVRGAPTGDGPALMTQLSNPVATQFLQGVSPPGDLAIADATLHRLYAYRTSARRLEAFGTLAFSDGPWAIRLLDAGTLLIAADNKIYASALVGGVPTGMNVIVGQPCGTACRGFNPVPAPGAMTQLNGPTGVDFDALFVYIADSQNCRVRRASRNGTPMWQTTVFAGSGCDRTGDIYNGTNSPIPAAMAHLGPVGDVRVGADGTVYISDPEAHCAVMAVSPGGSPVLRVIAGSPAGCGRTGVNGVALGRLGGMMMSDDGQTLYFLEQEHSRVGVIHTGNFAMYPIAPGSPPSMNDGLDQLRVGGVSGIAASGTTAAPTVYWSGAAEGKIYSYVPTATPPVAVFAGEQYSGSSVAIPASHLQPGTVAGLSPADGGIAIGFQSHHVIITAVGSSIFPGAGVYDTPGTPTFTMMANAEQLTLPGWPIVRGASVYFDVQGPGARVFRADLPFSNSMLVPIAGAAPGTDAGPPPAGGATAPAGNVSLARPAGIAIDGNGSLYVADTDNHVIWRVQNGLADIYAGIYRQIVPLDDTDNDTHAVAIPSPTALAFDGSHTLYVADTTANRIRAINLTTNRISTVAGQGSAANDFVDAATSAIGQVAALSFLTDRLFFGEADTGRVRVLRFAH